jgi:hypothetical protein
MATNIQDTTSSLIESTPSGHILCKQSMNHKVKKKYFAKMQEGARKDIKESNETMGA